MPNISKAMGVAEASISKINGIAKASISKFLGVEAVAAFVPGSATDNNADELRLWLDGDDASTFTTSNGTTNQPTDGYYKMTDGSGTTLTDSSDAGNSRNATLASSGVTWDSTNKKAGSYSIALDGSSGYIDLSVLAQDIYNQSWTVSFYYKSSATGADKFIFAWTANDGTTHRVSMFWDDSEDAIVFHFASASGNDTAITTPVNVQDGNWHHLILVYDGSGSPDYTLYIDGLVDAHKWNSSGISPATNDKIYLGRYDSTYLAANYDEIAVWGQALSPSQVRELYNNGTPLSDADTLKDDKEVTKWDDKSGNNYDAVAAGSACPRLLSSGINSKGSVYFDWFFNRWMHLYVDGNTSGTFVNIGNILSNDEYTIFIVFRGEYMNTNSATEYTLPLLLGGRGGYQGVHFGFSSAAGERQLLTYHWAGGIKDANVNLGAKAAVATYSTPRIGTSWFDGSNIKTYVDGNTNAVLNASTSAGNISSLGGQVRIGRNNYSTESYHGSIAEIIVYNKDLSASDLATVVTYLAGKWGITENNS